MSNEAKLAKTTDERLTANQRYLDSQLLRMRLLLNRRVLWLRRQWKKDSLQQHQGLVISDAQADHLLAGEESEAESRFYATDQKAAAISRALAEIEQEIARQLLSSSTSDLMPPLEMLGRLLGLTDFERDVLLLCIAPELDPSFEKIYAYVQDDVTRKYVTQHLALALLAPGAGPEVRGSLGPNGVLRHLRLVILEPGTASSVASGSCPIRLSERVSNFVMGINRFDERVIPLLSPMPPAPLVTDHSGLIDNLQNYISSTNNWPAVNIVGPSGSGKGAVARALCDRLGFHLFRVNASQIPASSPERFETMRLLEREAVLSQVAIYVDVTRIETATSLPAALQVADLIEQLNIFLIVGSRERWQSERDMIAVQLGKLDARAQHSLWQQALGDLANTLNGEIESLAQQFDFGPTSISQAVATARSRAKLRAAGEEAPLTSDDLWQSCREQSSWHLEELAQRIIPCHTWEDIVLPEDVYRQLQEIAAQVANRAQVYEKWNFGAKLNRGRGISALFSGPSGSGKTLAAEILADHLDLSLYRIDLSGVVSKYIGETEKNLRKVFDAAEQSGAIIFFDEADALFGKRSEVKDSHDRYANIEINYLLQRMEEYRGLAILATNMKSHLDQAFMRRLRFLVDFPFPDAAHRAMIWQKIFPDKAEVERLDYTALSRLEISGGNIKNIALNAAFIAAGERGAIRMGHIIKAARREYAKIDKLILESEFGRYYEVVNQ